MAASQVVSPLLEKIRALYGEVFDQTLQRNVTDALAEDIGDGGSIGVLANCRRPRRIESLGNAVQVTEERFDRARVVAAFEIGKPVELVAQRPDDDARMIAVVCDLLPQHSLRVLFPHGIANTASAPGQLVPDEET